MITFKIFSNTTLRYGVSTKQFGTMVEGKHSHAKNLKKFLNNIHADVERTVFMEQVHGGQIMKADIPGLVMHSDGLYTSKKNLFLCVKTADCLPIIFFDFEKQILGVVHAGYKGILCGVIENMIEQLKRNGSLLQNVRVAVGPGICGACYTVSQERFDMFYKKFSNMSEKWYLKNHEYRIDLKKLVDLILQQEGIAKNHIEISSICTYEDEHYFSYRRDEENRAGRFITVAGMI